MNPETGRDAGMEAEISSVFDQLDSQYGAGTISEWVDFPQAGAMNSIVAKEGVPTDKQAEVDEIVDKLHAAAQQYGLEATKEQFMKRY